MAMDRKWVAVPDACELMQRVRAGEYLEDIQFLDSTYKKPSPLFPADFNELVASIVQQNPKIESRVFNMVSREWDTLGYLLSPEIREAQVATDQVQKMESMIIYGEQILHAGAVTTIGFPIRYLPPRRVVEAADFMQSLKHEDIFKHFVPAKMVEATVYKAVAEDSPEWRDQVWKDFTSLRDLFCEAGKCGEGLLVVTY